MASPALHTNNIPRRRPAPASTIPPSSSVQQSEQPARTMSIQEELNLWGEERNQRDRDAREGRRRELDRGYEGYEGYDGGYGGGN